MVNYTVTGVAVRMSTLLSCFKGAQLTNIPSCGPSGPTTLWSLDHASRGLLPARTVQSWSTKHAHSSKTGGSSTEQLGSGLPIGMVKPFLEPCCTLRRLPCSSPPFSSPAQGPHWHLSLQAFCTYSCSPLLHVLSHVSVCSSADLNSCSGPSYW